MKTSMEVEQQKRVRTLLIGISGEYSGFNPGRQPCAQALRNAPSIELLGESSLCLAGKLLLDPRTQVVVLHVDDQHALSQELLVDLVASTTAKIALHIPKMDHLLAVSALRHGIRGFIPHSSNEIDLAHAINCIAEGEIWASRKLLSDAFTQSQPMNRQVIQHHNDQEDLTPREQEIVERLCSGLSNKEIARELNISDKTVKTHLQRIYKKSHVHSRLQLAVSN